MDLIGNELETTLRLFQYAKQDVDDVMTVTQKLYGPIKNGVLQGNDNIKIVDFDEQFVQYLESGESLTFKGTGNEKVVLCTEDETYEVKEGEISNSLVICPKLLYSNDINNSCSDERIIKKQSICGIYHSYLELRPTFPRLSKLREFLGPTTYMGPELEADVTNKGYTIHELLENIQCSREELLNGLEDISAFCVEGRWRLLCIKYESEVLSLIIGLMEERNSDTICRTETKNLLQNKIPDFIVDHILFRFATPLETDIDAFVLKEDQVCRCFAEALLTALGGRFSLDQFMKTWKSALPSGMEANLQHLHGLALTEKGKMDEDIICLFPEYTLPENISDRFRLLFKRKEKWTFSELKPYIVKLSTRSMNVNTMLTKFARASVVHGVTLFSARHAH